MHTSTWFLVFLGKSIVMSSGKPIRDNLYEPFIASDRINSLIGMIFNSIFDPLVGVLGNAEEIMRVFELVKVFLLDVFYLVHQPRMYTRM